MNKINEKEFYKLQEIISSFQLNDEYEKKLKELDDAVKKFFGVQNNENNWLDNKNKNDKFFQLNDKILVIATQYSIILLWSECFNRCTMTKRSGHYSRRS